MGSQGTIARLVAIPGCAIDVTATVSSIVQAIITICQLRLGLPISHPVNYWRISAAENRSGYSGEPLTWPAAQPAARGWTVIGEE